MQTVTLTQGLLVYDPLEQSEPFTVMGSTLIRGPPVTVKAVEPEMPPDVAVIVVVPAATDVASPVVAIVATPTFDELQTADAVKFCVVLSDKVPVALNCWVVPWAILGFAGVTAMESSVKDVTVRVVDAGLAPDIVAVIVVVPTARGVARPAAEICATLPLDDVQATNAVRS